MTNSVNSHGGETADDNSSHHLQLPEVDDKNKSILRNLIHQQLDEIRTGNAYVEHELNSDCFSKLLLDNDVYSKFEIMTAKKWMDVDLMSNHECGLNGGKLNKKRKQYVNAIKSVSDFVRTEIEQYTASAADGDAQHNAAEEDTVSSLSESKVSSTSQRRKKKSKKSKKKKMKDKKKTRRSKKRKRDQDSDEGSDSDMVDGDSQSASLTDRGIHVTEEEKARFEKEKRDILSKIPDAVKESFRELGFAKWGKDVLPVMFLGPYDVAPGPVRDTWFKMSQNIRSNQTKMSRLVFWYGTLEENMACGYSFIPDKSTFTYEEGCSRGYNKIPPKLQKKIDTGKKLTDNEVLIVDGLEQLNEDYNLPVDERQPWLFEFDEEYGIDDVLSVEVEEKVVKKEKKGKKVITKTKKIKNKKKKVESDDESKISTKKKKKRKRDPDEKSETSKKEALKHSKKLNEEHSKKLDEEIMEEVAEEEAFLKEEAPSEDDNLDDDFSVENESDSEDDDDLYEEKPKKAQPKKNTKPAPKKVKSKIKNEKKPNSQKSSEPARKKGKVSDPFEEEQRRFEECEGIFLPLILKLKGKDTEQKNVAKLLKKIDEEVDKLVPSFIEEYNIGLAIKDARKRYKAITHLNDLCKNITTKMKSVYRAKKDSEPLGFQPKVKKKPLKKVTNVPKQSKKKQPQAQPIHQEKSNISKKQHKVDVSHREKNNISKKQHQTNNISSLSPKRNFPKPNQADQSRQDFSVPKKSKLDTPNITTLETKVEKVKPSINKKKPFSLLGMIERPSRPSTNGAEKETNKETMKEIDRSLNTEATKLPKWIINYNPAARKATSTNIDREFAMDFLDAAVACLPKEKIDPHSVALALEDALYTKYESDAEKYWERVHYICAAMARKKELGQLAQKIIAGAYASPNDVIQETMNISWESLKAHYFF